jgi:hypothetical protein
MECEAFIDSGEWKHDANDTEMSINFEDLNPKDKVVIRTRNSTYRFLVTDPTRRQGVLTGGTLGNSTRPAVLIESFIDEKEIGTSYRLRTGARSLFYLSSGKGVERMATSIIEELAVIRKQSGTIVS